MNHQSYVLAEVQSIEVNTESTALGWDTIATSVSAGSWAVVLVLGVILWQAKEPVGKYLSKQMEVLDKLKGSLDAITASHNAISKTLEESSHAHTDQHAKMLSMLDDILDTVKK